ncbi:hypothetical protein BZA70DRAFT_308030 [Myxozyma melibiosi]|uniref:Uncharacterized protein n=1 Tax=Myxozyma melibiosi TaxID=54550 RepID=A0ABR1FB98_9ASCO
MRFRFKLTPTILNLSFSTDPQDVAGSAHFNVLQTPQRMEPQFMYDSDVSSSFSSSTVPNAEVDSDYNDSTYAGYDFPASSLEVLTDDSISEETTGYPDASEFTTSNVYRASYDSTDVGHSDDLKTINSDQSIAQGGEHSTDENGDTAGLSPRRSLLPRRTPPILPGQTAVPRVQQPGLSPGQVAGRLILDMIQAPKSGAPNLTPGQAAGRLILDLIKSKSSINRGTLHVVENRFTSVSSDPAIVSFVRAHETESEQPAGGSSALTQENCSSSEILSQQHRSFSAPTRPSAPVRRLYRFSGFAGNWGNCTDALGFFACKAPHIAAPSNGAQTDRAAAESQPAAMKVRHQLKSSKSVKKSYGEIEKGIAATTTEEDSTARPDFDPHSDLPIDHVHSLVQKFEAQQATIPDPKFLHSKFYRSRTSSGSFGSEILGNVVEGPSQQASEPIVSEKADEPEPIVDRPSETIQEDDLFGSATVSTGMQLVLRHEVCMDSGMETLDPWSYEHLRYPRPLESTQSQIQPRVVVPDHMENTAPVFRRMVLPGWVARALQPVIGPFISRELVLLFGGTPGLLLPPSESSASRELILYRPASRQQAPLALRPAP